MYTISGMGKYGYFGVVRVYFPLPIERRAPHSSQGVMTNVLGVDGKYGRWMSSTERQMCFLWGSNDKVKSS